MKKLLITVFLGLLAAYVAFKGTAWYQTKRMLDAFQQATELDLAFSHGWIGSSLAGEVTIDDVVITPFQLKETIPIAQIRLSFASLTDMLSYLSPWALTEELQIPDGLELFIEDAQVPLSDNWRNYSSEGQSEASFFGLACGDVDDVGLDELRSMGYGTLSIDQQIAYGFDRREGLLSLRFDTQIEGMQHSAGELELQGLTWPPVAGSIAPKLKKLKYLHEDLSYMKRLMLMCGKKANLDEPGFINASMAKTEGLLAKAGVGLSPSLMNAYKTYLKGDGIAEILLYPSEPLDFGTLPFLEEDTLAQSLGFSLKLNRIDIPDAEFTLDFEKLMAFLYPPEPEVVVEPEPEPEPIPEPSFQPIEIEELERYIGMPAQITQRSGKVVSGVLKTVDTFQLTLDQQLQSGVVSFHIKKSDIQEAMVLR